MADYLLGATGSEERLCNLTMKVKCTPIELGKRDRLSAGKLVKDVIAVKRSWSFSWRWLAGNTEDTHDGGLGRNALRALFDAGEALNLVIPVEDAEDEAVVVMFGTDFPEEPVQTSPFWKWNVGFTLEEV